MYTLVLVYFKLQSPIHMLIDLSYIIYIVPGFVFYVYMYQGISSQFWKFIVLFLYLEYFEYTIIC